MRFNLPVIDIHTESTYGARDFKSTVVRGGAHFVNNEGIHIDDEELVVNITLCMVTNNGILQGMYTEIV